MFRALRKAWGQAREKRLPGLFAFEFAVIVLGVLTAQGVQSWVQEREQRLHAQAERMRLEQGVFDSQYVSKVWRASLPCLRERVRDAMRTAGAGGTLNEDRSRRPKLVQNTYPGVSPETSRLIEQEIGPERTAVLLDTQDRFMTVQSATEEMRVQWEVFRLLDPEFGATSAADRAAVRAAGAAILNSLRTIEVALDVVEAQAPLLSVRSVKRFNRQFDVLPVRNCGELWAKGTAYRSIEPGEPSPF